MVALMKILYPCWLGPDTTDYPLFIAAAWEKSGHRVVLFPYDLGFFNRSGEHIVSMMALGDFAWRSRIIATRLDAECGRSHPDVLLLGGNLLTLSDLEKLRRRHDLTLGSIVGYNHLMEGNTVELLRTMDFLVVHDSYLIPVLQGSRLGKVPNVFFMSCMASPEEHRPIPLTDEDRRDYGSEIAFIGGVGTNRIEALKPLSEHDLRIWGGSAWGEVPELARCFRPEPVYGLKKTKIYAASAISY